MASESYTLPPVSPALTPPSQNHVVRASADGLAAEGQSSRATKESGESSGVERNSGVELRAQHSGDADRLGEADEAPSTELVSQAVERINEMLQNGRNKLKFELDDDAGRVVVKVLDAENDELVRQIPSEETLKFAEYVEGLAGLILTDEA